MFKGNLKPVIRDNTLVFRLSATYRILFFIIAALLAVGIIYSPKDSVNLWIPALIAVISIAGGMYTERWIFSKKDSMVQYLLGIPFIPFLRRKEEFGLDEIHEFIIEKSSGYKRKKETMLITVLESGERYEIDSLPGTGGEKILAEHAEIASEFCGKPLRTIP